MKLASGLTILVIPLLTDLTEEQKGFLREWIRALRSGEFKQGQGTLRTMEGEFCCLGVMSELECRSNRGFWKTVTETSDSTRRGPVWYFFDGTNNDPLAGTASGSSGYLTNAVSTRYGLPSNTGLYMVVDKHTWPEVKTGDGATTDRNSTTDASFADLNDSGNATFEEIASIMELAITTGYCVPGMESFQDYIIDINKQQGSQGISVIY